MLKTVSLAALLAIAPAAAIAMGSGMGMYGAASFGGGGGGNASLVDAKAEYASAMRFLQDKDYDHAVSHLLRALRVEQGNAGILNDLGYATRMAGDYPTAADYLQRAIARDPDLKMAHVNLGAVYLALHQPDDARQQLAELARLCPDGCEEKDGLAQGIAAYDAAAKAAPAH